MAVPWRMGIGDADCNFQRIANCAQGQTQHKHVNPGHKDIEHGAGIPSKHQAILYILQLVSWYYSVLGQTEQFYRLPGMRAISLGR